jgi:hypothetical protein
MGIVGPRRSVAAGVRWRRRRSISVLRAASTGAIIAEARKENDEPPKQFADLKVASNAKIVAGTRLKDQPCAYGHELILRNTEEPDLGLRKLAVLENRGRPA